MSATKIPDSEADPNQDSLASPDNDGAIIVGASVEAALIKILDREKIPADKRKSLLDAVRTEAVVAVRRQEVFIGPLPHPTLLERYESASSGSADRIITMAESQSLHRMKWEAGALKFQFILAMLGLIFALMLGLSLIFGAIYLATLGQVTVPSVLLGVGAVGMVSSFVKGRNLFSGEQKAAEEPPPSAKQKPAKRVSSTVRRK